jgi:hypothetical protein
VAAQEAKEMCVIASGHCLQPHESTTRCYVECSSLLSRETLETFSDDNSVMR